jgi:hypothetical protein
MALTLDELRKLPKSELWKFYDNEAKNVQPSLNYFRDEILRREQSKQTAWLIVLTILVLVFTFISAIGVVSDLLTASQ